MTSSDIPRRRLAAHRIGSAPWQKPEQAVAWMGAMQAQDYASAKWAVGLRCAGVSERDVELAFSQGRIVRTWAMRGTLQAVAAADARWLLGIVGPPALARIAALHRREGLHGTDWLPIAQALDSALGDGRALTREELFEALRRRGIETRGQRGYHILNRAGLSAQVCFGAPRGKQQTFVLLDAWLGGPPHPGGEEALAELALRYVQSHGPAGLQDFVRWSGLPVTRARAALEGARPRVHEETVAGRALWVARDALAPSRRAQVHLLPAFDEYVLGYADRSDVIASADFARAVSSNGIFWPVIVSRGRVVGTWSRAAGAQGDGAVSSPFAPLSASEAAGVRSAARRYAAYLTSGR